MATSEDRLNRVKNLVNQMNLTAEEKGTLGAWLIGSAVKDSFDSAIEGIDLDAIIRGEDPNNPNQT